MSDNLIDKTAAFVEAFNAEDLDAIIDDALANPATFI